jgi:alkylhydroperoxidase family enzyme
VFHLGGDENTPGVTPEVECYPAGQAAGGIGAVTPAAEIVAQVIAEAEGVLAHMADPLQSPAPGTQPAPTDAPAPRIPLLSHEEAVERAAEHNLPEALADLNIFRAMLNHPKLSKWFSDILMGLLWRTELDHRLRELVIMRLGWSTASDYEWTQHWRIAGDLGVSEADLLGVRDWQDHDAFNAADRAVLAATDDVVANGFISAPAWDACVEHVSADPRVLLELVSAIGMWRMVSTVLRSTQIPLEDGVASWPPDGTAPMQQGRASAGVSST